MGSLETARIPPIRPAAWSREAQEAFAILGSVTKEAGAASNLAMTMANHGALAKA
jgi:hypothetical protein